MPVDLAIPDNMTYGQPTISLDGEQNWVRYIPVSGESWTEGSSFKIVLNSDNEFLNPSKSYLKFNLKLNGVATTSDHFLLGCGSLFSTYHNKCIRTCH